MTTAPDSVKPKFQKGDIVVVACEPYDDCPFGWAALEMDEYCGVETTITDVRWSSFAGAYGYSIAADNGEFTWCENCFSAEPDIEESDCDHRMLLQ